MVTMAEVADAAFLRSLPSSYYPLFDVCHILLCVLAVRKECGGRDFAFRHPTAALVSCMVSSFAGSLLCYPLLGKPMFGAFKDEHLVLWCFAIFIAVNFTPGDLFYQLVNLKPVYVPIAVLKEIYRGKKIFAGLQEGATAFPASPYLIPIIVAVLKGNGSAFAAPFARAVRGDVNASKSELMTPSVTTKECLLGAILMLTLADKDLIYISLILLFITIKLGSVFGQAVDPFKPAEEIVFGVLKGLAGSVEKSKAE